MTFHKIDTKMMAKAIIFCAYIVLLISSLDLIAPCQCSPSATNQQSTSERSINNSSSKAQEQSRKLTDEVEIITSNANLIGAENPNVESSIRDDIAKEFQYFNDPSEITTPKHDSLLQKYELAFRKYELPKTPKMEQPLKKYEPPLPPPSIKLPNNHRSDISDFTQHPYYQQFEPIPFIQGDSIMGRLPSSDSSAHSIQAVQVVPQMYSMVPGQSAPPVSSISSVSSFSSTHPESGELVKFARQPIWAPEAQKVEEAAIGTIHSIRTSMMNIYLKVYDIVNYVWSFFAFYEKPPFPEGRALGQGKEKIARLGFGGLGGFGGGGHGGGGGGLGIRGGGRPKIKKKLRRFILPLLIAYKLKFFTLIPLLTGGLCLLLGTSGMAGFFFALFTAAVALKSDKWG